VNVSVENLAPCKKLVRVELDATAVDSAFDAITKDYQKQAALPGFRPGKAPRDMVLKKYGAEIKDEAKASLRALPEEIRRQIGFRLHRLQQDFSGDVKKLKGSKNEYRLRVGDYRVLFELVGNRIVVYTVGPRKGIYE